MQNAYEMKSDQLTIRPGQMVFDVPSDQEGVDEIVYAVSANGVEAASPSNLGGAWRDLVGRLA